MRPTSLIKRFAKPEEVASLVAYAFLTLRGYLQSQLIASSIAETASDSRQRELLVRGVAAAIREEAALRGVEID